jgi:hypothetical protein
MGPDPEISQRTKKHFLIRDLRAVGKYGIMEQWKGGVMK